jgi:Helix-turn-helix domain
MSWQSLADVFEYVQRTDGLTTADVIVLLALANYTDENGQNAYPSLITLQQITKLSRRKIQYTIRHLKARLLLSTTTQRGRQGYQRYALHLPHVLLKGAPHAPLPRKKGAPRAPLKVHVVHPDPVQRSHVPPEKLKAILASLGVSPDSRIYHLTLNGAETSNDNGEHG